MAAAATLCEGNLAHALEQLSLADPRLGALIQEHGPPVRLLAQTSCCFPVLVKAILYQQLAGKAAAAIHGRFLAACGVQQEQALTPEDVLRSDRQLMREAGLSERKVQYVVDLAAHFSDGRLTEEELRALEDAELLASLTRVKGIGPWTVDMFSMFHLGRPNVLPVGDLGVRKGLQHLFQLRELPGPAEMQQVTAHWEPWRSIGCYYMWKVAPQLPPAAKPSRKRAAAAAAAAAAAPAAAARASSAPAAGPGRAKRATGAAAAAAAAAAAPSSSAAGGSGGGAAGVPGGAAVAAPTASVAQDRGAASTRRQRPPPAHAQQQQQQQQQPAAGQGCPATPVLPAASPASNAGPTTPPEPADLPAPCSAPRGRRRREVDGAAAGPAACRSSRAAAAAAAAAPPVAAAARGATRAAAAAKQKRGPFGALGRQVPAPLPFVV